MTGVSRFDCYPSDFLNGVIGLTGDEIAAYTVVMMLQYDRGEPVAYVGRERELSVRSGLPKGRLAAAIQHLIEIGKLFLEDGALFNKRTSQELEKISERIRKNGENSASGGESTRQKWEQKRKENNGNEGRPASRVASRNKALLSPPPPSPTEDADASSNSLRSSSAISAKAREFYFAYPKRVDPREAESKFAKLVRQGVDPETIIIAAQRYAAAHLKAGTEKQFIPAPAVWLNKGGYLSEDLPEARAGPRPAQVSLFPQPGTDPYGPDRSASAAARRNLEAVQRGEDPFAAIRARRMPPRGGDVPSEFIAGILPQK